MLVIVYFGRQYIFKFQVVGELNTIIDGTIIVMLYFR